MNYQAGTLTYTRSTLVALFIWLLWGGFCANFLEALIPTILPLLFKKEGISSTVISTVLTSIPAIVLVFLNPIVQMWSDRFRSSWGRRIPFITAGIPMKLVALLGIGFYEEITLSLAKLIGGHGSSPALSCTVLVFFVSIFFVSKSFTLFPYLALFNDTVPRSLIGRFSMMFRVVGTIAVIVFNFFLVPLLETHFQLIFIGVAVVFVGSYMLMCVKVKEGEYADVPVASKVLGIQEKVSGYFKDFFSHRLYVWISLDAAFSFAGNAAIPFYILMHQNIGLNLKQIGMINGSAAAVMVPSFLAVGFFIDKINYVRLFFYGRVFQSIINFLILGYLFAGWSVTVSFALALALNILLQVVTAVMLVAYLPMQMLLFPQNRFGQYSSALSLTVGVLGIFAGPLMGGFFDLIRFLTPDIGDQVYRYAPLWAGVLYACAAFSQFRVHKKVASMCGGDLHKFVPPGK